MSQVIDVLEEARAAAGRQSWRAAYGAYSDVGDAPLTASDLESYGEAAWWSGKLDEAISLREHRRGSRGSGTRCPIVKVDPR